MQQSRITLILALAACVAALVWLSITTRRKDSRYLSEQSPADWIVYPLPAGARAMPGIAQHTVFRRSFSIEAVPTTAFLQIQAFQSWSATLNGSELLVGRHESFDVAPRLRRGNNELEVTVANDVGPPALLVLLRMGDVVLVSDSEWAASLDGAVARPARRAGDPYPIRPGNLLLAPETTLAAWQHQWRTLAALAVLAIAGAAVWPRLTARWQAKWLLAGIAGAWAILFANNLRTLIFPMGFDAFGHLEYIEYLQHHWAVPLAREGWKMDQPPLYYISAALVLSLFGLGPHEPAANLVLRGLGLATGIAQVVLLFASLRLLFPGQPRRQWIGTLLMAFVPMHLYLAHHVSNALLASTLATASLYLCLRIIRHPDAGPAAYIGLGVCLGAGLLTQITALVPLAAIIVVLGGSLLARRPPAARRWLGTVGATCLACGLVAGWYYVRVWYHYGTPLVGDYDAFSGIASWWQQPGCATPAYLSRFGASLLTPAFSSFHSFGDGVYSTLWADGMWSGVADVRRRPPWNHDLMAAAALPAIVPCVFVAIGAAAALAELIREPRAERFLIVGLAFLMSVAVLYNFLRLPYYGSSKAYYGMAASLSCCAFGGMGFDIVARRWPRLGFVAGAVFALALLLSYASFWVVPDAVDSLTWLGIEWREKGDLPRADGYFEEALRRDPAALQPRLVRIHQVMEAGDWDSAEQELRQLHHDHPASAEAHLLAALFYGRQKRFVPAEQETRQTLALAPDHPFGYLYLAALLREQDRIEGAIQAYREALRVTPASATIHQDLADLLAKHGDAAEASVHRDLSQRLDARARRGLSDAAADRIGPVRP